MAGSVNSWAAADNVLDPANARERQLMEKAWEQGYKAGWSKPEDWADNPYSAEGQAGPSNRKSPSRSTVARKKGKEAKSFLNEEHDRRFNSFVQLNRWGYQVWLGEGRVKNGWLWLDAEDQRSIRDLRRLGGKFVTHIEDWQILVGKPTPVQFAECEKPEDLTIDQCIGCQWNTTSGTRRAIRYLEDE